VLDFTVALDEGGFVGFAPAPTAAGPALVAGFAD
jgi:hypothetical protein